MRELHTQFERIAQMQAQLDHLTSMLSTPSPTRRKGASDYELD